MQEQIYALQKMKAKIDKDKNLIMAEITDARDATDEVVRSQASAEAEVNAMELDAESRRSTDICKNLRKSERSIKELTFAADENKKNHERMQALIDQLQGKVKSYKKQIEEAEEIAALNLAKFRKAQQELEETEERAKLAMVV